MSSQKDEPNWQWLAWGVAVLALVLVIWGVIAGTIGGAKMGPWADSYGPLAAVLNAAALGVALWTVTLQRIELGHTREELKMQREAQQEQAKAQQEQARVQARTAQVAELQLCADTSMLQLRHLEFVNQVTLDRVRAPAVPVAANKLGKQIVDLCHEVNRLRGEDPDPYKAPTLT